MSKEDAINAYQQYLNNNAWHWLAFEAWCHINDVDLPQHEIDAVDSLSYPACNMEH